MKNKPNILFINMAKEFGGGEFYSEQLMQNLDGFNSYFLGKKSSRLNHHISEKLSHIKIVNLLGAIKLILSDKQTIVHALDGRGVHLGGLFKYFFKTKLVITRQVNFDLKRKFSQKTYSNADMLVGVSKSISKKLQSLNTNVTTIYGCIKPLQENNELEEYYFSKKTDKLKIAQIANFSPVKNFTLTIELARKNDKIEFYLVGSGNLESELKTQAKGIDNIIFIIS